MTDYATQVSLATQYALSQVGGTYSENAIPPKTWDCSKLTAYAWKQAGIFLTPYSYTQRAETTPIDRANIQPGDLIFYFENGSHHVVISLGGTRAVSATSPSVGVELLTDAFGGWYGQNFTAVGRVRTAGADTYKGTAISGGVGPTGSGPNKASTPTLAAPTVVGSGIGTSLEWWKRAGLGGLGALLILFSVKGMLGGELSKAMPSLPGLSAAKGKPATIPIGE